MEKMQIHIIKQDEIITVTTTEEQLHALKENGFIFGMATGYTPIPDSLALITKAELKELVEKANNQKILQPNVKPTKERNHLHLTGVRRLNGKLKLSREAIEDIVFTPGETGRICNKYGVSHSTVWRLRDRINGTKAQKLQQIRKISKPA